MFRESVYNKTKHTDADVDAAKDVGADAEVDAKANRAYGCRC